MAHTLQLGVVRQDPLLEAMFPARGIGHICGFRTRQGASHACRDHVGSETLEKLNSLIFRKYRTYVGFGLRKHEGPDLLFGIGLCGRHDGSNVFP